MSAITGSCAAGSTNCRGAGAGAVMAGKGPLFACSAADGFPTRGWAREEAEGGAEAGSRSRGKPRDSVNIALAERGLPTFGFRIARS